MKLGVFDSGIGGEAVAAELQATFPDAEIITVNDRAHVPYGDKQPDEIITLTDHAIQPLVDTRCDIIILACNTATAVAIETLRAKYPDQKFIGIEPMIKTASELTKSKIITVCATPATLSSARYAELVEKYAGHLEILEPDCSEWAYLIENNLINKQHIEQTITDAIKRGSDVIVLGCTHYHWIKNIIIDIASDKSIVIEPSEAIASRVKTLLAK